MIAVATATIRYLVASSGRTLRIVGAVLRVIGVVTTLAYAPSAADR